MQMLTKEKPLKMRLLGVKVCNFARRDMLPIESVNKKVNLHFCYF